MSAIPAFSRRIRRLAALRAMGAPVYRFVRQVTASGAAPPIIVNSVPKAGTHLLTSILNQARRISFSGRVVTHDGVATSDLDERGLMPSYDESKLARLILGTPSGTYTNAHLYHDEFTSTTLRDARIRSVFMVRDPRDIVVSQLNYIEGFPAHELHDLLKSRHSTRELRLDALIDGWPADSDTRGMADIGSRVRMYLGWGGELPVFRFEDFVAPDSPAALDETLERFLQSTDIDGLITVEKARAGIGDPWSPTIHKGSTQGWRRALTHAQADRVQSLAADSMTEFGYEAE